MRLSTVGAVVLAATSAQASDSYSPFFISSTADIDTTLISQQTRAETIQSDLSALLQSCPTKNYIIVSQPGTTISDYQNYKDTPALADVLTNKTSHRSSAIVRHVSGTVSTSSVADLIEKTCGAQRIEMDLEADESIPTHDRNTDRTLAVMRLLAPSESIPRTQRKAVLKRHDALLATVLYYLVDQNDYTLIYTTSPSGEDQVGVENKDDHQYETEIPMGEVHGDLKRSVGAYMKASNDSRSHNYTLPNGPLFEKYTFFSPGLFMGAAIALLLTGIAYVGISALLSLQVTYGAFDKEQGALANRKTQ